MQYDLFDYQRVAALQCLDRLRKARRNWRDDGDRSAFALSAVTGAGKTVIASAVIEAVLNGSTDLGVEADERACFLWVTDDPALNRQTRDKMLSASDLTFAHFGEPLDATFKFRTLQRGRIYFLNIQQLGAKAGFGTNGGDKSPLSGWEVIGNTISDPGTDLYVVLDEAHRGMTTSTVRPTIVRRIIDGNGANPPAPIVWGISATIERFISAMGDANHHTMLKPDLQVDVDAIKAAGIIKDRIELDQPDESGDFHQTLLRAAVDDLRDFERRWGAYHESDGVPLVRPVLVVQVADKADKQVPEYVSVIEDQWGEPLDPRAIVNVFGEHADISTPGGRVVRYLNPESIQNRSEVRVVLAKTAISTGWDCPRAEVLFSERPAKDATHIAQVIGRMVRSPLAHRVTGDDALNSVVCYLPRFDRDAVTMITEALTQPGEVGQAAQVTRRTETFERSTALSEDVFELVAELPSWPKPDVVSDPLRRARLLAALLVDDRHGPAILADAGEALTAVLNARLDGLAAEHKMAVAENVKNLESAEIRRTTATADGTTGPTATRTVATALSDLDRQTAKVVRATKEGFGADYRRHRYVEEQGTGKDELEIRTEIAALLMIEGVAIAVRARADEWTREQLAMHASKLKLLTGTAAEEYLRIKEMAATQEQTTIMLPRNVKAPLDKIIRHQDAEDELVALPTWPGHIYTDTAGRFPLDARSWEAAVLDVETDRDEFVAWYRNPSAAGVSSLRIGHQDRTGNWGSVQVDFIVVERRPDGTLAASILDPHGDYLADAVPKLKALAAYADQFGSQFSRISALSKGSGDNLRVLELTEPIVRAAVLAWDHPRATGLYDDHSLSAPYA